MIWLVVTIFLIPVKVFAIEKIFTIEKLNIKAEITEDATVEVEEAFNYSFQGSITGIYRNLKTQGTKAYEVKEISIIDSNNITTNLLASDEETDNTYKLIHPEGNTQIKIFNKSNDEKKQFIIKYNIIGAVLKNSDFSELNWKFYTVENQHPIKDVLLNIKLKNSTFNKDKLQCDIFNTGGQFTSSYKVEGLDIKVANLSDTLGVDLKFQPDFIKDQGIIADNNNNNNNNFNNNTNAINITNMDTDTNSGTVIFIFIGVGIVGIIFLVANYNKKFNEALAEYRSSYDFFKGNTLSEKPEELSPAFVNYLYNEKIISNLAIPATIYYLSNLGFYSIKKDVLKKGDELRFYRDNSKQLHNSEHLNFFIDWMSTYEKKGSFSFKDIKKSVKSSRGTMDFNRNFTEWKKCVENEVNALGYFTIIENRKVFSNETYNEMLKWLAYRKFLSERFSEEVHKVTDINDAMIYSIALELDKKELALISEKLNIQSDYDYSFYTNYIMWEAVSHNMYNSNRDSGSGSSFFGDSGGGSFGGDSGGSFGGDGGGSAGGGGDSGAF